LNDHLAFGRMLRKRNHNFDDLQRRRASHVM
jgi:hypothetical protein